MDYKFSSNKFGNFYVPTNGTGIAHVILGNGEVWEEETINFIINNCNNKTIVSAGAFIGDFIIPFSKNTNGKVISFEPETNNYYFANKNIELNNLKNIVLSDYGLSNSKYTSFLKCKGAWFGSHNKDQENMIGNILGETAYVVDSSDEQTVEIKLTDLDSFLFENEINDEISIIQLDIEGHEMKALEGSKITIEKNLPIIISESVFYGDIYEIYLKNLGYKLSDRLVGHRFENSLGCLNYILYIPEKHNLIFD
jgi:FkbM family methyltransferase